MYILMDQGIYFNEYNASIARKISIKQLYSIRRLKSYVNHIVTPTVIL